MKDESEVTGSGRASGVLTPSSVPAPVQRYLDVCGVTDDAHIDNFVVHMKGDIRSGPHAPWMPFVATQWSTIHPMSRVFVMDARMFGLPVRARHVFEGPNATMKVKLASLFSLIDARGDEMNQSETVTLLNDLVVFAPAALMDARIEWTPIDHHHVRARFTHYEQTVSAILLFDDHGRLVDFVSDDRLRASPNGKSFARTRWSTPLRDYRHFGPVMLAGYGEAVWHDPAGAFPYVRMEIVDVRYNVPERPKRT